MLFRSERAIPVAEATGAMLDDLVADARAQAVLIGDKDAGDKLVTDTQALRAAIGV